MGLDAVVYRNKEHLQLGADEPFAQTVLETGEVYFENNDISRRYAYKREAAHARLGNVASISALRHEIGYLANEDSLLYSKVVYSGTHSGDYIPVSQTERLQREILSLGTASEKSAALVAFLDDMGQLVRAALEEGNPIVFV